MMTERVARHIEPALDNAVQHFRVVLVHGPRQSGKTTIVKEMVERLGGTYWSLDDPDTLSAVTDDPLRHLSGYPAPVAIDEIQRGGDRLIRRIKMLVDENPSPGRFIITGSTNFLTVPNLSESLAGRMSIYDLWPLSVAEQVGAAGPLLQGWFDEPFGWNQPSALWDSAPTRDDYFQLVCRGGYPEPALLDNVNSRQWCGDYLRTVVDRDIRALSRVRLDANLDALMLWAAGATSQEINISKAAQTLSISRHTLRPYLEWLKTVGLIHSIPHWSRRPVARSTHRPKLHLADTGLAASLLGVTAEALASATAVSSGPLLESFVVNEAIRQISAANPISGTRIRWSHFRPHGGDGEVDLVLDRADGAVIAMEVKATSTPQDHHTKQLRWLRDRMDRASPGSFRAGYLLHTGKSCLKIADRIHFRPIATLWQDQPPEQMGLL